MVFASATQFTNFWEETARGSTCSYGLGPLLAGQNRLLIDHGRSPSSCKCTGHWTLREASLKRLWLSLHGGVSVDDEMAGGECIQRWDCASTAVIRETGRSLEVGRNLRRNQWKFVMPVRSSRFLVSMRLIVYLSSRFSKQWEAPCGKISSRFLTYMFAPVFLNIHKLRLGCLRHQSLSDIGPVSAAGSASDECANVAQKLG